jgi:hypothetical protein
MSERYTFEIVLAAEPGATFDEATRALRASLKLVGRSYGLRCLSAIEVTPDAAAQDAPQRTNEVSDEE